MNSLDDAELVALARSGDAKAMTAIFDRHASIVPSVVGRYQRSFPRADREDMLQVGYIGLLNAVRLYRADRGEFSHLAFVAVRRAVIHWLRSVYKLGKSFAIKGAEYLDEMHGVEDQRFDQADARLDVDELLDDLDPDRREAIVCIYGLLGVQQRPQGEYAASVGRTSTRIAQRIKLGLRDLRLKMEQNANRETQPCLSPN